MAKGGRKTKPVLNLAAMGRIQQVYRRPVQSVIWDRYLYSLTRSIFHGTLSDKLELPVLGLGKLLGKLLGQLGKRLMGVI